MKNVSHLSVHISPLLPCDLIQVSLMVRSGRIKVQPTAADTKNQTCTAYGQRKSRCSVDSTGQLAHIMQFISQHIPLLFIMS